MLRSSAQRAADQHGNADVVRQGDGFVARPRFTESAPTESHAEDPPGRFDPVFRGLEGNTQGALEKLLTEQTGEAPGALLHPHVGPIDLIWGKAPAGKQEGFGVAKLAVKHPEVLDDVQGFISRLSYDPEGSGPNRTRLMDATGRAMVSLNWRGESKTWLLTAFEERAGGGTTMDTATRNSADDTASRRPSQENVFQNAIGSNADGVPATKPVDAIARTLASNAQNDGGADIVDPAGVARNIEPLRSSRPARPQFAPAFSLPRLRSMSIASCNAFRG